MYAVTQIDLYFTTVVYPGYTESDDTFGFYDTLQQGGAFPFGVLIIDVSNRQQDFVNGLQILFFTRVTSLELAHKKFNVHNKEEVLENKG